MKSALIILSAVILVRGSEILDKFKDPNPKSVQKFLNPPEVVTYCRDGLNACLDETELNGDPTAVHHCCEEYSICMYGLLE